jgi:xylan 1,4-beta-xylosidase
VCRSQNGVQALFWNFTLLKQDATDQIFYKRDLPAKSLPPALLKVKNLPAGKYQLQIYAVGYRRNDVYSDFLDLGSPRNLSREQVRTLAQKNNGAPLLNQEVEIKPGEDFQRSFEMRENDVYLVTLKAR